MSLFRRRREARVDVPHELVILQSRLMREVHDMHKERTLTAGGADFARDALRRTIESYMIYATVGRDRKKLDMDWVEKAEASVRDHWGMAARF